MITKKHDLNFGLNWMVDQKSDMLMDIGVIKMKPDHEMEFLYVDEECVFLLLLGEVEFTYEGVLEKGRRKSIFDDNPSVLHVSKGTKVKIKSIVESEVIIQKTLNDKIFENRFYPAKTMKRVKTSEKLFQGTATRDVLTIVDHEVNPESNLVIGEVFNYPGKWSSYIPHYHPQPEVYLYRFDKPQGFGAGFVGDDVYKLQDNTCLSIPGYKTHPQVAAPGYAMYFCWMIRHLEANPWKDRINEKEHEWLLDENALVWGQE